MSEDKKKPKLGSIASIELVLHASFGEFEPLAKHLEDGGNLTNPIREFLIKLLRDELPKRKGRPRTYSQFERDFWVESGIKMIMRMEGCTEYAAKNIYLDVYPDMERETLDSILRRMKNKNTRQWSKQSKTKG